MKCADITCQQYNSEYVDNCSKDGVNATDCPDFMQVRGCHNCAHFEIYKGCPLIMKCKNYSEWEK